MENRIDLIGDLNCSERQAVLDKWPKQPRGSSFLSDGNLRAWDSCQEPVPRGGFERFGATTVGFGEFPFPSLQIAAVFWVFK